MEFLAYLTEGNVINFLLLLLRFAGIIAFFPFFENQLISTQIKGIFILIDGLFRCGESLPLLPCLMSRTIIVRRIFESEVGVSLSN